MSPKGLVHNLLMQFFTLGSSKIEVSETYFFDTVTTHSDHPSYIEHVLGSIYVFFTLSGCALLGVDSLRDGRAEGNRISLPLRSMAVHCSVPRCRCCMPRNSDAGTPLACLALEYDFWGVGFYWNIPLEGSRTFTDVDA